MSIPSFNVSNPATASAACEAPGPLRRSCALPNCDENCSYCRENDRIAAARRGLPFLAPAAGAGGSSPSHIPQIAFGGALAVTAASGPVLTALDASSDPPALTEPTTAATHPAAAHHPGLDAAQAAVATGTIAPASSAWWAHVLGTTNAPTQEQFDAMTPEQQAPWTCIICGWGAALADSPQPGRVCSYECMYDKYR